MFGGCFAGASQCDFLSLPSYFGCRIVTLGMSLCCFTLLIHFHPFHKSFLNIWVECVVRVIRVRLRKHSRWEDALRHVWRIKWFAAPHSFVCSLLSSRIGHRGSIKRMLCCLWLLRPQVMIVHLCGWCIIKTEGSRDRNSLKCAMGPGGNRAHAHVLMFTDIKKQRICCHLVAAGCKLKLELSCCQSL